MTATRSVLRLVSLDSAQQARERESNRKRAQEFRRRERQGIEQTRIENNWRELDRLVERGLMTPAERADTALRAAAISRILRELSR